MITYEYECGACGKRFERRQAMADAPLERCPSCGGNVRRLISGGAGFILTAGRKGGAGGCSLESTGATCCGRNAPCGEPCGRRE